MGGQLHPRWGRRFVIKCRGWNGHRAIQLFHFRREAAMAVADIGFAQEFDEDELEGGPDDATPALPEEAAEVAPKGGFTFVVVVRKTKT